MMRSLFLIAMMLICSAQLQAQSVYAEHEFDDPAQTALFQELAAELRCLVCQNQNIADSNAELAQDLRRELYTMIKRGDSKKGIVDFMVERYGEFILYRPLLSAKTMVLWLGPLIFFLGGLLIIFKIARRRKQPDIKIDEASLASARSLLDTTDSDTSTNKPN
ncbi:hypothetical protein AB833_06750 [Chromatiales bacterium (ex Bugula neritina AB1)]|nr:hypothetical protein AB833_06750 [Chromatiales bacterium (ex Bugula neritina AB1)]